MYVHPLPSADELKSVYSKDYFHGYEDKREYNPNAQVGGYVHLEEASRESFLERLDLIYLHKKNGRLLDIGCAVGHFLKLARIKGWDTYGVEISEYASEYARKQYSLDVRTGKLLDAGFDDEFFDVVTMWDVIEHLYNPRDELKDVFRILKPNGLLLITTANMDSYDAKFLGKRWGGIISPPGHVYYFTLRTFNRLLNEIGFDALNIRTIGYFAEIPYLSDVAFGIRKHFPAFITKIDNLGWGNTIFAILRKRVLDKG
jgi:2-polyprenyl-3-methyl-5-hydroxy-6-metoxy-1,4-benzoquinol methylase